MDRLHGDDGIERRMRDGRPNADIRLIESDDTLREIAAGGSEDFRLACGVSPGGNEMRVAEVVSQTLAPHRKSPRSSPWGARLAADRERAVVLGTCGFVHGPDAEGTVEIGHYTFPPFQSRGYAGAMARQLLALALRCGAVTEPDRRPSQLYMSCNGAVPRWRIRDKLPLNARNEPRLQRS